ncbi:MAG: tetratricopeptide repeat protein, partial [Candidatus Aureabacteria bacterium]|nr:tetratricopeptide repeat protein [Candidatus Auribacterota bacterium]
MDEILKTQGTVSFSLDEKDVEKYARNLKEFEELRNLEKQFSETYSDLMETKTKLSFLESEIKATREEEERKKSRMEELFDSGETKEKGGLLEEAIELYLEVLSLEPKNVRAIYHIQKIKTLMKQKENERFQKEQEAKKRAREVQDLLESGKRFYREGQFERALEEFQSAVSLGGKQPEALKYAEECEQRIREINEILNKAKKESEEKKRLLHEWMVTANTHLRMEEYEQAIGFLEKALLLMPDNKEVQETLSKAENQFREKKKVLEKARAEGEEKLRKIREWQLKAQDCLNNKDQSKAVSYLEQILILDPHREEILREIKCIHDAMMQAEKEEKSKSEREKKELEDREFQIRDNYVMGIQYFMTGQYQQAVGCFTVVMKLNPNYEELELYMKRVEERLLAEEEQKRLDLQKEREWNVKKREMEWEAKQKREAEVRDFFESALKFLSQGDYLQAVTILEKCYAMDPSNPAILVELEKARAKLEEKNKREEADRIKEAEKQEKERQVQKQIVFIREQAEIYFNENEFEKSIKEWEKIMEFDL